LEDINREKINAIASGILAECRKKGVTVEELGYIVAVLSDKYSTIKNSLCNEAIKVPV